MRIPAASLAAGLTACLSLGAIGSATADGGEPPSARAAASRPAATPQSGACLPGGTVFRERRTDARYTGRGSRLRPAVGDVVCTGGVAGTTLTVHLPTARADRLTYVRQGRTGGDTAPGDSRGDNAAVTVAWVVAGAGAGVAVALCAVTAVRLRRRP